MSITIGIDVSKDRLDAARHPGGDTVHVANTRKGQTALLRWIGDMKAVARVVFEPTCSILDAMEEDQAPITRQSGKWRGRSFIQGGRATLQQALYMPAIVAVRFNPDRKHVYNPLVAKGKHGKIAIAAIMQKLVVLANALLHKARLWTPKVA